ncbi:hypothetical protein GCM10012275_57520 [Longimycelium tulufanense]|uniref:HTH cro/C1-type domain-containing protein n=1 Tax=Longimycelium tulufanense TaxID=907463 RepID=A0A8J3CJP5_9PSEU|nr:helix-turn-helix transcriptional regulator [Longimycelium tulufanense]GGM79421.1 hypothetical protein GCM10012275_57520 [Longimycelium tulufanense]
MGRRGIRGFDPNRLRTARTQAGLTLAELSTLSGVSAQTLSQWELGRTQPTPKPLAAVAKALDTTPHTLTALDADEVQLDDLRSRAGLTITEAAAALRIGETTLRELEHGRRPPSTDLIDALATLYRVTPDVVRTAAVRTRRDRVAHIAAKLDHRR